MGRVEVTIIGLSPLHLFGRTVYRCSGCGCNYSPNTTHVPGSEDCDRAYIERTESRSDRPVDDMVAETLAKYAIPKGGLSGGSCRS